MVGQDQVTVLGKVTISIITSIAMCAERSLSVFPSFQARTQEGMRFVNGMARWKYMSDKSEAEECPVCHKKSIHIYGEFANSNCLCATSTVSACLKCGFKISFPNNLIKDHEANVIELLNRIFQDNGKVSRCDELIRLTAQKLKAGACAKALAFLPDRRKRASETVPESLMEVDCTAF